MSHSTVLVVGPRYPRDADDLYRSGERARKLADKSLATNYPEEAASFARKAAELRNAAAEAPSSNPMRDRGWLDKLLAPFDENMQVDPYRDYEDPLPANWEQAVANKLRFGTLIGQGVKHEDAWTQVWGERNDDPRVSYIYNPAIRRGDIDLTNPHAVVAIWNEEYGKEEPYFVDNDGGIYQMSTYNPKSRWDWWSLGGRWAGYFLLREDAEGVRGEDSWAGGGDPYGVDLARKGDIDWEAMAADREKKAAGWWDEYQAELANGSQHAAFQYSVRPNDTRECYIRRSSGIATFAVLLDGEWYEKGKMGWWGVVADEQDQDAWNRQWVELIGQLPEDTLLALVDVHI